MEKTIKHFYGGFEVKNEEVKHIASFDNCVVLDSDEDEELEYVIKRIPGVMVLVHKNRGLLYLDHSDNNSYWHKKCINKAIKEYQ
jgi:hypothetical protein